MTRETVPHIPPTADWPAYWFVALERAVADGDYEAAAEAQRELRRLGVEVRYRHREGQPCTR